MPLTRVSSQAAGILTGLLLSASAGAVDPFLHWKTLTSDHFHLHFHQGEETQARRILTIAEEVHERLTEELQWYPRERTQVVLTDELDLANGFSTPIPANKLQLYLTPPDEIRPVGDFDDWYRLLITHEYTHLLHLDKAYGGPAVLRRMLGRNLFSFPNIFQPSWVIEGLATYEETNLERGHGRGQESRFAMLMREELESGLKPFDQVSMSGLTAWPGGEIPYLYGVYFFQFLEERYGKHRIRQLVDNYSDNMIPFLLHSNFQRVLGLDTPELWAQFETYLKARFAPQLEAVRARGIVAGERLSEHGYRTGPARATAEGVAYYVRDDHLRHAALMRRAPDGATRKLADVHFGARIDWHPKGGILVAQPEYCDNYSVYYDLYQVDAESGRKRRLTRCGRYRFAAWSPDGQRIAAVQVQGGESRLLLLDGKGRELQLLWEGGPDDILSQPDWSPDGTILAAPKWRRGLGWNLEAFDLATGQWRLLTRDEALQTDVQFAADGTLLFSADYGGIYNLHRLEPSTGRVTALTNVESGAFSPSAGGENLFYIGYTAEGYDLFALPQGRSLSTPVEPPGAASVKVAASSPRPDADPDREFPVRDYSPWSSLAPTSWFPVLAATEQLVQLGASTYGEDALGVHHYAAAVNYEVNFSLAAGELAYLYNDRLALLAARSHTYWQDPEGEVVQIRQTDQWEVNTLLPLLSLDSVWTLRAGVNGTDEKEIHRDAGVLPLVPTRDTVAGLGLTFDNAHYRPRAISRNEGRDVRLTAESSDTFESDYSGEIYTLDWREFLPLGGRHVLALRFVEGWGTEQPRPFELGGNTAVVGGLLGDPFQFNRREYALRGYPTGLASLSGRRMQLGSAEWRFPVATVQRGFQRPPVGLHELSAALFIDSGGAWNDGSSPEQYATGAGLELSADVNLFYLVNLRLRLGFAHGFNEGGEDQVYLTLGAPF